MRKRNWVFGNNAGITFSPTPVPFVAASINTIEGSASISDTNGNLLLYSDGEKVWNGSGVLLESGLKGSKSSTQAALIVPDPAPGQRYYVFTSDGASGGNNHFDGIRIDLANGMTTPLSSLMTMPPTAGFSPTEKLVAVRRPAVREYWILTVVQPATPLPTDTAPGVLRVFRLTKTGITHFNDQPLFQPVSDIGYMKVSSSGKFLALANMWKSRVLVFRFNSKTGIVDATGVTSIPVKVPPHNTNGYVYGVEFSPNNNFLYYSTLFPLPTSSSPNTDGHIFQYMLPNGPSVLVGSHPNDKAGDYALGALQLANDGRIYVAQDGETKLGVIAQPNVPGAGCTLTFGALTLAAGSTCRSGLPNMIHDMF